MGKPQRKPKTPARHIDMPKSDYQPSSDEKKQEVDMPGVDLETARRAFFRPIKSRGLVTVLNSLPAKR